MQTKDKIFEANKYVQDAVEAYEKIKIGFEKTRAKQKKNVDRHRHGLVFSLGDQVLLPFKMAWYRQETFVSKSQHAIFLSSSNFRKDQQYSLRIEATRRLENKYAFHVTVLSPIVGDVP